MRLADMLRGHASANGGKPLIVDQDRSMTFAEVDRLTDRVAVGLRQLGVGLGDRVAMLMPNGVDFVVAFMSCNKAGAISVPINPRLAAAEVAHLLDDSMPKAAFVSGQTREALGAVGSDRPMARIAADSAEPGDVSLRELAESPPEVVRVPHDFNDCMIGYTSGTTGEPKGVLLTDANYIIANGLMNAFMWGLGASDRHLVTTPMVHRTGLGRVVNAICHGSTVFSRPRFDPDDTRATVAREGITVLSMVPTVGRLLLSAMEEAPADFTSVRKIVATGEAFPTELKRRIAELVPHAEIHSYFAMTEGGLVASLGPDDQLTHPTSVGKPAPGVEVELWDDDGVPVPRGEVGELCIRTGEPGRWLTMKEYFGRPELTAATIVDGWVKTGDMARMDEEDFLYIVDRKKDMVLTGGYNVYSKDVEAVLLTMDGVADVAVIGAPDPMYGERVVAVVEMEPGAAASADAVIEHCRGRLAGYKKPREVVFVEKMPRTSVGKLNKSVLRAELVADR